MESLEKNHGKRENNFRGVKLMIIAHIALMPGTIFLRDAFFTAAAAIMSLKICNFAVYYKRHNPTKYHTQHDTL